MATKPRRHPKKYSAEDKERILRNLTIARSGPRGSVKSFLKEAGVTQSMVLRWQAEADAIKVPAPQAGSIIERAMRNDLRKIGDVQVEMLVPKIAKPIVPINTDADALTQMIADRDTLCSQRNDLQVKINALNQEIGSLIGTG